MQIIYKDISEIRPYENNPRHNEEAIQYVANSIDEFGFKVPIIIDKNNVVVAGHTRIKAAERLKIKSVPCIVADDLSEEQIKAFRLADNKVSEFSIWDYESLGIELQGIEHIDMTEFGFDAEKLSIEDIDQTILEAEMPIARELNEANNYIVLEFFTETEWEKAQIIFGIEKVSTGDDNKNIRRYGLGRVIDGEKVLEMITDED